MANEQNLRPGEYKFSQEDVMKSHESRERNKEKKKRMRECLETLMYEMEYTDKKTGEKKTGMEIMCAQLVKQGIFEGDKKAMEMIRDTLGEKPTENVRVQADVDVEKSSKRLTDIIGGIKKDGT